MPGSTRVRVAVTIVVVIAAVIGYRWWTSPERVIRISLNEAASALNHDRPASNLSAIAAVAVLNTYLTPDVLIEVGPTSAALVGRQEVVAMAARLRASTQAMRVQLFDEEISFANAAAATVHLTAQVTGDEDLACAYQLTVALVQSEGRWLASHVTFGARAC